MLEERTGKLGELLSLFISLSLSLCDPMVQFLFLRPTNMNKHSSRSHAIFMLTVDCCAVSQLALATVASLQHSLPILHSPCLSPRGDWMGRTTFTWAS